MSAEHLAFSIQYSAAGASDHSRTMPLTPGFSRGWQVRCATVAPFTGLTRGAFQMHRDWPVQATVVNDGIDSFSRISPRLKPGVSGTAREGSLTSAALY